jgi:hypothetical protein
MNLRMEFAACVLGLAAGLLLLTTGVVGIVTARGLEGQSYSLADQHREVAAKADDASRECYLALAASAEAVRTLSIGAHEHRGWQSVRTGLGIAALFGFLVIRLKPHRFAAGV